MKSDNKDKSTDKYLVPAVEQALRVLFHMAQAEAAHMSLTEICEKLQMHKSTAFCTLHTLQKYCIVQTAGRGKGYTLGPGLIGLSRRFLDTLSPPKLAEPLLADLARAANATAALGLIADKNVFVAAKHEGERVLGITMRVGHRFPLTYGCHGKAIAAFMREKDLEKLLTDDKLYFHGDPSRFDKEKLREEMRSCRRDWYAEDLQEMVPGLIVVASPVLAPGERPIGYLAVLGLASADAARQCGPLVAQAAKKLSRQLGAKVEA
ncbi:MAG: IclR family transcriptional regulator [Pseudomonadota bacterium]